MPSSIDSPLEFQWYHSVEPSTAANSSPNPTKDARTWIQFSDRDSKALERAFQSGEAATVPVNEDLLFQVDVAKRILWPIYWTGPICEVRRATWYCSIGWGKTVPCREDLAAQIEEGYCKHLEQIRSLKEAQKRLEKEKEEQKQRQEANGGERDDTGSPSSESEKSTSKQAPEHRVPTPDIKPETLWQLEGPFRGLSVIFYGEDIMWLLPEGFAGQLSKLFYSKFGTNLGANRLYRGYKQAETEKKAQEKEREKEKEKKRKGRDDDVIDPITGKSKLSDKRPWVDLIRGVEDTPEANAKLSKESEEEEKRRQYLVRQMSGYGNEWSEEEPREIDHLVFVVHGMGQKLTERLEAFNFVYAVNIFRKFLKAVPVPAGSNLVPGRGLQVLPINWRTHIKFGSGDSHNGKEKDLTESNYTEDTPTLSSITLEDVPAVRSIMNDILLDLPLYMTPQYHDEMIRSLKRECNRVYRIFLQHHPYFIKKRGRVSIVAHSLGSALVFDALCQDDPNQTPFEFDVYNFFSFGSPIGFYLLLRNQALVGRSEFSPSSKRKEDGRTIVSPALINNLYNVFHRSDPIAYRIEPHVCCSYATSLKPATLPTQNRPGLFSGLQQSIDNFQTNISFSTSSLFESVKTSFRSPFSFGSSTAVAPEPSPGSTKTNETHSLDTLSTQSQAEQKEARAKALLYSVNTNGRIDYILQDTYSFFANPYLGLLHAHTGYWDHPELAAFVMEECYKEPRPEPHQYRFPKSASMDNPAKEVDIGVLTSLPRSKSTQIESLKGKSVALKVEKKSQPPSSWEQKEGGVVVEEARQAAEMLRKI
ncbi:uncharacterized protein VTP21DRAFT_8500 [Calcarisporiella thermophila]|uniref:uncharacterized protein n=1 Tax=Calcarisporiella thermophila TaxID=911321 RepID=UPI003742740F